MADAPLTLGTAGHIDHGKTALVRALTGKDTDRLPEEKGRGISIELGYARLELPSGRALSVVDVPGHERFVRTMVAGATGVDMFLMCIAADDGVMPQTREHLAVLQQLGVEQGVIAITKADVTDPEPARDQAAELMPGIEAVAVAAPRGEGIGALLSALDRVAGSIPSRAAAASDPTRLHVDRSFSLKGIGTVVTGTLWSGSIGTGDRVELLPSGLRARVRSVQVHDVSVPRADAGQRVALNLVGVARDEVGRGDVIAGGGTLRPAHIVDVRARLEPGTGGLEAGMRLQIHHGTRETAGRAYPLGDGFVQLRLEQPIIALAGDHLILRQVAPPDTIGGAVVVDPTARRHGPRAGVVERLVAIERGEAPAEVAAAGQRDALTGSPVAPAATAPPAPRPSASAPSATAPSASAPSASAPSASAPSASAPSGTAPSASRPPAGAPPAPESPAGAQSAAGPPAPLDEGALALRAMLRADAERPRTDGELAAAAGLEPGVASTAWRALEADGSVVRVARGLHFDSGALRDLTARVLELIERDRSATIASVRDELGTSRKYAQALLEHLDATKVTLRRGDEHVLRRR